ncbi:hypothetical protein [Haloglomus halophilum]|uniref:hypothetical protein n=1 Tax=Haloglomus halophilum TaxID=2962672 RepID=UPI0020C9EF6E|nr:hypothetical protein [Haloglomus halophilum]
MHLNGTEQDGEPPSDPTSAPTHSEPIPTQSTSDSGAASIPEDEWPALIQGCCDISLNEQGFDAFEEELVLDHLVEERKEAWITGIYPHDHTSAARIPQVDDPDPGRVTVQFTLPNLDTIVRTYVLPEAAWNDQHTFCRLVEVAGVSPGNVADAIGEIVPIAKSTNPTGDADVVRHLGPSWEPVNRQEWTVDEQTYPTLRTAFRKLGWAGLIFVGPYILTTGGVVYLLGNPPVNLDNPLLWVSAAGFMLLVIASFLVPAAYAWRDDD